MIIQRWDPNSLFKSTIQFVFLPSFAKTTNQSVLHFIYMISCQSRSFLENLREIGWGIFGLVQKLKHSFKWIFFFLTQVFWHVMTQKHMGWKIPGLPKSWVFSTQSRFSGSFWGPESKINKRNSAFWLVVFLPSLMELWCVPRDSLPHN